MITMQSTNQMTVTEAPLFLKRKALRQFFNQGIKPVDGRQPIPEELAQAMVQELIEFDVPKDALIGVVDSFMILTLVLQEHGFTNLVLLENTHKNLTPLQETYYNTIEGACEKIGVKYYVPPMNNYSRCDMEFDVVIGNFPFQNTVEGSRSGSSSEPLWWQITNKSFGILKDNGILSAITPTTLFSGGEQFTSLLLGEDTDYNLKSIDFSADDHFNVGIDICRWVAYNSKPEFNVTINDGRVVNSKNVYYISTDIQFDEILTTLRNFNGSKLTFNQSNRYDYNAVARELKKLNLPIEWAKDLVDSPDTEYIYPVANNDKIKYSRIKWKDYGVWRVFIPQFTGDKDLKFWVDDKMAATGTTWTHRCKSKEEAEQIMSIVDTPEYKFIINKLKLNGRITGKIRSLPAHSLQEILSSEQLSYIQSQL
jgi:hypothetical protein